MTEPLCVVYQSVNRVNGKRYIGATDRGLSYRANRHKWDATHGKKRSKFHAAIRKYGFDRFEFSILAICGDFFAALDCERQLIATEKPEYNLTAGGGGVKGFRFSQASREKMAAAKRGKPAAWMSSPDAAMIMKKIGDKRRGKSRKPLSKEHALAFTGAGNASRRRAVIYLYDGTRFESVAEAARAYGLTTGQVSWLANGNHESRRGHDFRYADERQ